MTLRSLEKAPVSPARPEYAAPVPHRSHAFPARVAVTGADGFVGQALMLRLLQVPTRAVGLVRHGSSLQGLRVVKGPLKALAAQSALGLSECIVHLAGALRPGHGDSLEDANVQTARAVAQAVAGTDVRRIIYLSYVGASLRSYNRYLAAKAAAERELRATGCDLIVLRCTHIVGPPELPGAFATALLGRRGRPVHVVGNGTQLVAPVALDDVVTAIVRAMTVGRAGVYELAGPDLFDFDELVEMLNGPDVRIRHLGSPIARMLAPLVPGLSSEIVDLLLRDSVADPTRAISELGLELTPLRSLWGRA